MDCFRDNILDDKEECFIGKILDNKVACFIIFGIIKWNVLQITF